MTRSTWLDFLFDLLFASIIGLLVGFGVFRALGWAGCALMLSKLGAALAGLGVTAGVLWRRFGRERATSRWRSSRYGRDSGWDTTGPGVGAAFVASVIVDVVVNVLGD